MWVRELSLKDFRNLEDIHVNLENGMNVLYGDNGNGKTNLLEAIYFCATGKSQRAGRDSELIRFGKKESHIRVLVDNDVKRSIDVHLFYEGKKKGIAVDKLPIKNLSQLFGILLVIIFTPEDLEIIKAGPAERRSFLDLELCQLSKGYYHALKQYHKALKQRNNLLKKIPKDKSLQDTLSVWDEPLYKYGVQIMSHRSVFVNEIEGCAKKIHSDITGGKEALCLAYKTQVTDSEQYKIKLQNSAERDIILGNTAFGIHKDDILFTIDGNDARIYGSQGQKRTAALSVKLAGLELVRQRTGHSPVLLLDDIFSELDDKRQQFLVNYINGTQTILTCTGMEGVLKKVGGKIMKMENGKLK